jgi:hypothetical protein
VSLGRTGSWSGRVGGGGCNGDWERGWGWEWWKLGMKKCEGTCECELRLGCKLVMLLLDPVVNVGFPVVRFGQCYWYECCSGCWYLRGEASVGVDLSTVGVGVEQSDCDFQVVFVSMRGEWEEREMYFEPTDEHADPDSPSSLGSPPMQPHPHPPNGGIDRHGGGVT